LRQLLWLLTCANVKKSKGPKLEWGRLLRVAKRGGFVPAQFGGEGE
jgi:hypothetical protein